MNWFSRAPMSLRAMLEETRRFVPDRVQELFQPTFLIGVSPRFVGLHDSADPPAEYADSVKGLTYDDLAHACYGFCHDRPTIVFPKPQMYANHVGTMLHEWGHLFDEATGFALDVPETTVYSRVNREERIAEAFELTLLPPSGAWADYMAAEAFRPLRTEMGLL